ncbi:DUF3231 family protein [Paenibacillus daejeonensis]|uniref:DUF3231 family protein n=1 Tax=Paenibacillus daejeonensis TaxID=135193 RepID=UPI000370F440|nr:DUF3231 family protein [Paenibacillus daejeonensis]
MGILSGNPKEEPLHYGEIFEIWTMSTAAKGVLSSYETFLNHAGDEDLKDILHDLIQQANEDIKNCDKLLMDAELIPPPGMPSKPKARLEDIPLGARFSDAEIAATISAGNAAGLVFCSHGMGISIREDVGAMFTKCHALKTGLGVRLLKMMKEKSWLVPPPLHMHKAELVEA